MKQNLLSPRFLMTKPQKRARKDLEKSKPLKLAIPRPLPCTYDYISTAQLGIGL